MQKILQKATFGGGCFWCVEAVFQRLKGVSKLESGYAGGKTPNPTYKDICTGTSGHAEVIQLSFDAKTITYDDLLRVFFLTHDPTTLNRQGNDIGTQYRSVIFYHDNFQKQIAEEVKDEIEKKKFYNHPIVTEIVPYKDFTKAESEHQNFYNENLTYPYCVYVVQPKVDKLMQLFREKTESS